MTTFFRTTGALNSTAKRLRKAGKEKRVTRFGSRAHVNALGAFLVHKGLASVEEAGFMAWKLIKFAKAKGGFRSTTNPNA